VLNVLLVGVSCWLMSPVLLAEVSAKLDRNHVVEGETVTLILQTDNPQLNLDADLSFLEADFEVLDRRSETQMSIVNGKQSAVVKLLLTLEPLHVGDITIPAIRFGSQATQAISMSVAPAPEPEPGALPPVFIEVEVEPKDSPHYVHAQLGLTVRVYYQQNLTEAAISQPEPSPASVRLLDEVPYQAERGGGRFRVLERRYAIFPERSGQLTIPPLKLSGRLVERRSDRLWQPTVRGRRIEVESDPIVMTIQPKPAGFAGDAWQPARRFRLTQQISASDSLKVGEPVTRTVIVDAVGLEENMIAEPVWPEVADVRIYPDQPQGISRDDGQWVLGHKEFRYAVVPEKEGELNLPELTVQWWDTVADQQRIGVLPAKTLQVQASANMPVPKSAAAEPRAAIDGDIASSSGGSPGQPAYWRWLAFLFAALWLLTLLWNIRSRGAPSLEGDELKEARSRDESSVLNDLKRSCDRGDAGQARRALSAWLVRFGPRSASASLLEFAATLEDEALRDGLYAMDRVGFHSADDNMWDSKAFWKTFASWRKASLTSERNDKPGVIDLYARENRV
jgi:hypothetical protein